MQKKSAKSAAKPAGKPRSTHPRPALAHQVRIIGGQWKRTPLPVLDAEGLRPTPDRVRETIFNWLNHLLHNNWEHVTCLDLFAGTGALGFEAASRGAKQVIMVEANTPATRQLLATLEKLQATQVSVIRGDAASTAQKLVSRLTSNQDEGRFKLIFLDPPYHQNWLEKILPNCAQLLSADGVLYAESEYPLDGDDAPEWMKDWQVIRADKAGMVYYHLLQRKNGG
jgi:16S rRNA (guanine(966)-N(2))-methyltransferase RsmD